MEKTNAKRNHNQFSYVSCQTSHGFIQFVYCKLVYGFTLCFGILQFNINNAFWERRCRMATIIIECCACAMHAMFTRLSRAQKHNVVRHPFARRICLLFGVAPCHTDLLHRQWVKQVAVVEGMNTQRFRWPQTSNEMFYGTFRIKFELNLCILRCHCLRSTFVQRKRNYFRNTARTCGIYIFWLSNVDGNAPKRNSIAFVWWHNCITMMRKCICQCQCKRKIWDLWWLHDPLLIRVVLFAFTRSSCVFINYLKQLSKSE